MTLKRFVKNRSVTGAVSRNRCWADVTTMLGVIGVGLVAIPAHSAQAETRGYVISWFATATNSKEFKENCPDNRNGGQVELQIRNLMAIGYSREDAVAMANRTGGQEIASASMDLRQRIIMRAKVNGKPASIYNYPDAVEDPDIETVVGKHAYGFDLGGPAEQKFIDPQTNQKVDNQLWRAVGCTESFNAVPPVMPYPEELAWQAMTDSAPAWIIRITGENLDQDGEVSVILDRATRHPRRDALGNVLAGATYVIEPGSRSHNELKGRIVDGVLSIDPSDIYLEAEMPYYPEIALSNTHMRLALEDDGRLSGVWGGIQNWRRWIYMFTARPANNADTLGIFHAVKKMADFDPDPQTGENRAISTAYRMEAVPAYLALADGSVVAQAVMPSPATQKVADSSPATDAPAALAEGR